MVSRNRFHHLEWLYGIEFFQANFDDHLFGRHSHEGFAIGSIIEGVGGYFCRGENMVLPTGYLSLMNPEETHTGHAQAGQLRYHMLYVSEDAARTLLDVNALYGFKDVTLEDRNMRLCKTLGHLNMLLNEPDGTDWQLGVEEAVHQVIATAFSLYGKTKLEQIGSEIPAITQLKCLISDGIENHAPLSLTKLAYQVNLHPSYLVRCFSRHMGLTPHAYVMQSRIQKAKKLLVSGATSVTAALEAGFYDQSHMIRQFRKHYGVSPSFLKVH